MENIKFVLLLEGVHEGKNLMKWARCKTIEEVLDMMDMYYVAYPDADWKSNVVEVDKIHDGEEFYKENDSMEL